MWCVCTCVCGGHVWCVCVRVFVWACVVCVYVCVGGTCVVRVCTCVCVCSNYISNMQYIRHWEGPHYSHHSYHCTHYTIHCMQTASIHTYIQVQPVPVVATLEADRVPQRHVINTHSWYTHLSCESCPSCVLLTWLLCRTTVGYGKLSKRNGRSWSREPHL